MIATALRYVLARRRLAAHQRRHGDLLHHDALQDRADALLRVSAGTACGLPVGGAGGYYCTEAKGHDGRHRHFLSETPLDPRTEQRGQVPYRDPGCTRSMCCPVHRSHGCVPGLGPQ